MPLSKAIQFSSLASQLTPSETILFIKNVADSNHQIIIDALSSYFLHASPNDERVTMNNHYIKSISTIIQSRDSQTEENSSITFDSLPRRLIGVCGSFLEQGSFRSLFQVNRAVYLGCNSPIVLTELHKHYRTETDHSLFDFSAFPFVKKLGLQVVDIHQDEVVVLSLDRMNAIASQIAEMSQLQSLELFEVDSEFIGIIANHESTNRRIKCLYVKLQQTDHGSLGRFFTSITSFKHLQFLKVLLKKNAVSRYNLDIKPIIEMCSNLKGLDFYDSHLGIEMAILQAIGHQLHYLTFHDLHRVATSALKDVNFANLQQLVQGDHCSDDSFRFILKTAINLEKVRFRGKSELITEILTQCKRLKYLDFDCDVEGIDNVLDVMACFFERGNNVLKETLKIRIFSYLDPSVQQQTRTLSNLQRVVNSLSVCKVNQWMIILDLYSQGAGSLCSFRKQVRRKLNGDSDIARTFHVGFVFGITNPNCSINGIGESWLM